MTKTILAVACAAAFTLVSPHLFAQDAGPAPNTSGSSAAAGSPNRQDRMAEFRQRMNERLKTALSASDDEWAVIQPLLEKVQDAQMATMSGRFGGMGRLFGGGGGGPRGSGNGNANANASPSASPAGSPGTDNGGDRRRGGFRFTPPPEVVALQQALASDGTSVDDIKAKLQAVRDARKKADANLEEARENLKNVLTLRQEAILVEMGVLD